MPDTDAVDLDHVAIASERAVDNLDRYFGDLGGRWVYGGHDPGFYFGQVRFANGMKVEMLEPDGVGQNDFLRRFLDRNGPGPHHLTFHVPDIEAAIADAAAAGYEAVSVNLANEDWKEAFLHPKQSHGVVVQMAQTSHNHEDPPDVGLPPGRAPQADLERVTLSVADLDAALELFAGVLDGAAGAEEDSAEGRQVDLAWPGPGRVRLVAPGGGPMAARMGGRAGWVHHVAFAVDEPGAVRGAVALGDGIWEILPEVNLGVRLMLRRR